MAATYSSFMTTRFYSPVFNTALFDGAFRIYFSQSYESAALKIYHLLQTEHAPLWHEVKKWSMLTKEHIFLLIYPDKTSVETVFSDEEALDSEQRIFAQNWDEGLAVGMIQPSEQDSAGANVHDQVEKIRKYLSSWLEKQSLLNLQDGPSQKQ